MVSPQSRVPPPNYFLGAIVIPSGMTRATAKAHSVRISNRAQKKIIIDGGAYSSEFDAQVMYSPRGLTVLLNWGTGQPRDTPIPFGAEDHYFDVIVNSSTFTSFNWEISKLAPDSGFPTLATCALWCSEVKKMNGFNARIRAREKTHSGRLVPLARRQASPLSRFRVDGCQVAPIYHDMENARRKHSASDFQVSDAKKTVHQPVVGTGDELDFEPDAQELK